MRKIFQLSDLREDNLQTISSRSALLSFDQAYLLLLGTANKQNFNYWEAENR